MKIKRSELKALRELIREQAGEPSRNAKMIDQKSYIFVEQNLELIVDEVMHMWIELDEKNPEWVSKCEKAAEYLDNHLDTQFFDAILNRVRQSTKEILEDY